MYLYCIVLYCIVLYCILLYCIMMEVDETGVIDEMGCCFLNTYIIIIIIIMIVDETG